MTIDKWLPERPKGAPLDNWDRRDKVRNSHLSHGEDGHLGMDGTGGSSSNAGGSHVGTNPANLFQQQQTISHQSSLLTAPGGGSLSGTHPSQHQILMQTMPTQYSSETISNPLQSQITDLQKQIVSMREQLSNLQEKEKLQRSDSEEIVLNWYRAQRDEGKLTNIPGLPAKKTSTLASALKDPVRTEPQRSATAPRARSSSASREQRRPPNSLWDVICTNLNLNTASKKKTTEVGLDHVRGKFYEPYQPNAPVSGGRFAASLRPSCRSPGANRSPESPRRSSISRNGHLSMLRSTNSFESSQMSPSRRECSLFEDKMSLNEVMTALYLDLSEQFNSLEVASVFAAVVIGIVDPQEVHRYIEDNLNSFGVLDSHNNSSLKSIGENHPYAAENARQLTEMIQEDPNKISSFMPPIYLDVNQFEEACLDVFQLSISRRLVRRAFHVMDKVGGRLGRIELKSLSLWAPGVTPPADPCASPRRRTTSPRNQSVGAESRKGDSCSIFDDCPADIGSTTPIPPPAPGRLRGSARPWLHGSKTLGSYWEQTQPSGGTRLSLNVQNDFLSSLRSSGAGNKSQPQQLQSSWNSGAQTPNVHPKPAGTMVPDCSFQFRTASPNFRSDASFPSTNSVGLLNPGTLPSYAYAPNLSNMMNSKTPSKESNPSLPEYAYPTLRNMSNSKAAKEPNLQSSTQPSIGPANQRSLSAQGHPSIQKMEFHAKNESHPSGTQSAVSSQAPQDNKGAAPSFMIGSMGTALGPTKGIGIGGTVNATSSSGASSGKVEVLMSTGVPLQAHRGERTGSKSSRATESSCGPPQKEEILPPQVPMCKLSNEQTHSESEINSETPILFTNDSGALVSMSSTIDACQEMNNMASVGGNSGGTGGGSECGYKVNELQNMDSEYDFTKSKTPRLTSDSYTPRKLNGIKDPSTPRSKLKKEYDNQPGFSSTGGAQSSRSVPQNNGNYNCASSQTISSRISTKESAIIPVIPLMQNAHFNIQQQNVQTEQIHQQQEQISRQEHHEEELQDNCSEHISHQIHHQETEHIQQQLQQQQQQINHIVSQQQRQMNQAISQQQQHMNQAISQQQQHMNQAISQQQQQQQQIINHNISQQQPAFQKAQKEISSQNGNEMQPNELDYSFQGTKPIMDQSVPSSDTIQGTQKTFSHQRQRTMQQQKQMPHQRSNGNGQMPDVNNQFTFQNAQNLEPTLQPENRNAVIRAQSANHYTPMSARERPQTARASLGSMTPAIPPPSSTPGVPGQFGPGANLFFPAPAETEDAEFGQRSQGATVEMMTMQHPSFRGVGRQSPPVQRQLLNFPGPGINPAQNPAFAVRPTPQGAYRAQHPMWTPQKNFQSNKRFPATSPR